MPGSVATVDLDAVAHNVRLLAERADGAIVCAVVKADGYGHGAVPVATAALGAGATWLGVAQVDEGRKLRAAGIDAPILLLSEPAPTEIDLALAAGIRLVVYRPELIDAVAARADALGVPSVPVHLKVDTGMRRVGCEPGDAVAVARRIVAHDRLVLEGTMTHLAVADEPGEPTTDRQLERFQQACRALTDAGIAPGIRHAANSAGTIDVPGSRLDLVRVGIAIYGIPPSPALADRLPLRPALRWTSTVRLVKPVATGDRVSYGLRHEFPADTVVATIPAGYADGVRRRLGLVGGEVLIRGRRRPIVGVVTMDQFVVDCGPGTDVAVGDEVVLVGAQDDEEITANEVAGRLDTIGYEITCAISPRVERHHLGRGEAAP